MLAGDSHRTAQSQRLAPEHQAHACTRGLYGAPQTGPVAALPAHRAPRCKLENTLLSQCSALASGWLQEQRGLGAASVPAQLSVATLGCEHGFRSWSLIGCWPKKAPPTWWVLIHGFATPFYLCQCLPRGRADISFFLGSCKFPGNRTQHPTSLDPPSTMLHT